MLRITHLDQETTILINFGGVFKVLIIVLVKSYPRNHLLWCILVCICLHDPLYICRFLSCTLTGIFWIFMSSSFHDFWSHISRHIQLLPQDTEVYWDVQLGIYYVSQLEQDLLLEQDWISLLPTCIPAIFTYSIQLIDVSGWAACQLLHILVNVKRNVLKNQLLYQLG